MRSIGILMGLLVAGCATTGARITHEEMAPRLSYQGFSFEKPRDSRWFILRSEEQHTDVTLRCDLGSPTHTFYVRIALGGLDRQPRSYEEFARLAHSVQQAPYRVEELSHDEKLVERQGQWCVRTDTVAIAQPSPDHPELRLVVRGYRCLHPAFPQQTLDFFYSERGLPQEIDPELSRGGEEFLEGVRIDIGPDTPAGNG